MVSNEDSDEIEEIELGTPSMKLIDDMKLVDYIPIFVPTIENGLLDAPPHERRFFDFLKARPSKDWFLKFGFVGTFLRRSSSNPDPIDGSSLPPIRPRRRRFRVPFVRKITWKSVLIYFKKWIKQPANMALMIWLIAVAVGLVIYFLLMIGLLNESIPSKSVRKRWTEITNQILNALFTIMCLYQHPTLFHHLVLLCRWTSIDRVEIRKVYCKDGASRPHERAQIAFVMSLLHLTCFSQYATCGLLWGFTSRRRPSWAVNLLLLIGVISPIIAAVYVLASPLGKKRIFDQEPRLEIVATPRQLGKYNRRVVVTEPEWIGGLFDCCDDPTVACCSFFCTFCVFGWNMERLGFGNMYVHIFTFVLLCVAPFLIFGASALNISDETIAFIVVIVGAVLCLFGFLYGGYWRTQMRKKFKLPGNQLCIRHPSTTDCINWLFCWSCSLAQEVRTGNFYDIEDASFYRKSVDEDGRSVLIPLPRESIRSLSLPPNMKLSDPVRSSEEAGAGITSSLERAATFSKVHAMKPPLQLHI